MKSEDKIELRSEEFQEVLSDTPAWILRWGIILVSAFVIVLLAGSLIFKYPDTISAEMTLTSLAPPVSIVAKTSGKLQELMVNDNDSVCQGDYLAIIENTAQTVDILALKKYLNAFELENFLLPNQNLNLGQIQANYSSFCRLAFEYSEFLRLQYYPQKKEIVQKKIEKQNEFTRNLLKQKQLIEEQVAIGRKKYERDSLLHQAHVIAYEELESTKNQYLQICLSLENLLSNIDNQKLEQIQMQESILDLESQYLEKKNTLELQLRTSINQLLTEIQMWEMNYALLAPIDGKVIFTHIWIENQNLNTGQNVFNVAPFISDQLIGKASLPTPRSGKVKTGQKVNIRFDNFPDNEFGMVRGIVKSISLVPVESNTGFNYIVDIELPAGLTTSYKKSLPYLPEMKAHAEIITEDISLLERLILPVKKVLTESLVFD